MSLQSRNYEQEFLDNEERKYAYDFDAILREFMFKTFHPFFQPGNALELGCFRGDVTKIICQHFKDLHVIEASQELIAMTHERLQKDIRYIHSTFETYNTEQKFDNIFLIHTLEHLDDPVNILTKINHWLSEHGRLFLAVPNANAASRQIAVRMGLITHNDAITPGEFEHGHRKTYSMDTLEYVIKQSHLKIISKGGVFFKGLANFQIDKALAANIIDQNYLDGCYSLGMEYPDLSASIYAICQKG